MEFSCQLLLNRYDMQTIGGWNASSVVQGKMSCSILLRLSWNSGIFPVYCSLMFVLRREALSIRSKAPESSVASCRSEQKIPGLLVPD